ncbi:hypothetical protein KBD08_02865 [Candidatus Babeliales bacterium]|nr:hypothetical protein [Candidatus Babeliales bacterium]
MRTVMRYVVGMLTVIYSMSMYPVCITVWVHGTYPMLSVLNARWSPIRKMVYTQKGLHLARDLPSNYYFRKLAQTCHDYNPSQYNLDHFYTYGWHSSNVRPSYRVQEGRKMYQALDKLLCEYAKKYKDITVRCIGFSHGGNVILNMLSCLPFCMPNIKLEVVLLGTPVQEATRKFINTPYVSKAYSFYSVGDWIQRIDVQRFHKYCPKDAPFWSQRTFKDSDKVTQVCLTINNKNIGHTRYRYLMNCLPDMLHKVDQMVGRNTSKCVSLNYNI